MERTASNPYKIAVLSSGHSRGTNLLAIHSFFVENHLPLQIALAVFNRADSPAYSLAGKLGICSTVISTKNMRQFEADLLHICQQNAIELIALAGFLKLLSADFIQGVNIPILNIHPALLPKYGGKQMYGKAVHQAVWNAGDRESGASIHLVDPLYDHGTVLAKQSVDISQCNTPEEIAAEVLKAEHALYAPTIYLFLSGQLA